MFWSDGNHLHFERDLRGDPLPVIAALHNLISKQGYQDVVLDFRNAGFLSPFFMLPLVTTCRAYRYEKVDFEIVLPEDRKTAALLSNSNWAHLISPERFEAKDANNIKHMSATQFQDPDENHKAVDASIALMLQVLPGIDRSRLKALEWALAEVTDNVINHASSPIGGVMQVMTFPQRRTVDFFVSDAGATIPRTLRQGRPDILDDITAVRRAIEEGVTKNLKTNRGNGLFGTFKCCEVSGGEFDILTGLVSLTHRPGQLHVKRGTIPFSGTIVRASIKYDFDKLLEHALVFGGKPHEPPFDYVDRYYQSESDVINFVVAQELNAFGSRDAGKMARTKIENLMDRGRAAIMFDFDNVPLISSSFADEVFGLLFLSLGPLAFGKLCQFKNVDRTVQGLIDRAISQRMRF